jgi:hypothetical protein
MAINDQEQHKKQNSISVISYNMHGFNQGISTVQDISSSLLPDVYILQEHWLTPSNLNKFDIIKDYFSFGSSAMLTAVESGVIYGRPFGGVMTLIKNSLRPFTQLIFSNERCSLQL